MTRHTPRAHRGRNHVHATDRPARQPDAHLPGGADSRRSRCWSCWRYSACRPGWRRCSARSSRSRSRRGYGRCRSTTARHAYLYGAATGVWNVDWITFWGMVLFNTLGVSGVFENFRRWLIAQGSMDVRVQTMLFAWAFGALLEGLVGFGYPWAVVAPILISLGISDLNAIRVAAIANNAPVSYGALGAPIIALAAVTGYPLLALSGSVGHRGRGAGAAAAVGAVVPGLGQGGDEGRLAARGGRLARLYRRPVSGGRPPRALSARHHRRDRVLHRAAGAAESLAAEDRARLRRRAGRCGRRQGRRRDTDSSPARCCRRGCRSPCC